MNRLGWALIVLLVFILAVEAGAIAALLVLN